MNQQISNQKPSNLVGIFGFALSIAATVALLFIFSVAESYWLRGVILTLPLIAAVMSTLGVMKTSKQGAGSYGMALAGLITSVSVLLVGIVWLLFIIERG